ncbi:luciferase family protein [Candidatus Nitrosocosmicus hydrocola]|uniref:luciferase family protein n=1 Tax=Candidatus Nitrosocosmicus hydrocola TaxID=1826872 RepID=UPI0039C8AE6D
MSLLKEKNIESSDYHIYPGSKWIVYYLNDDSDISTVLKDFRFQYDHIRAN